MPAKRRVSGSDPRLGHAAEQPGIVEGIHGSAVRQNEKCAIAEAHGAGEADVAGAVEKEEVSLAWLVRRQSMDGDRDNSCCRIFDRFRSAGLLDRHCPGACTFQ